MNDSPEMLPHRVLFRRPAYWLLMVLPIIAMACLHVWLSRHGSPLASLLPILGFCVGAVYGYGVTQWLRRRWGTRRTPLPRRPEKPET